MTQVRKSIGVHKSCAVCLILYLLLLVPHHHYFTVDAVVERITYIIKLNVVVHIAESSI